ncbi:MAG: hypothetical protein ACXV5Q_13060 [Frankiaceae bacterium]
MVELNRAVARAMAYGPEVGLDLAGELTDQVRPGTSCPAVRGELPARLGRLDEARAEYERAASLTRNGPDRALLVARAVHCAAASPAEGSFARLDMC